MPRQLPEPSIPRIEYLHVKNYRALHDLELKGITPLTVFLGPNASGKSTIFDVFAFLSECFSVGLRKAWDKRGRFKELRTRGSKGPIEIELKYRESPDSRLITYHLSIDEDPTGPYVAEEWMQWKSGPNGRPLNFLDFKNGEGQVVTGDQPDENEKRIHEVLTSSDVLAVNTLGTPESERCAASSPDGISPILQPMPPEAFPRPVPRRGSQRRETTFPT